MKFFTKQILVSATFLGCFSAFSYQGLDVRVSDLEKQMLEVSTKNISGTYGARFASKYRGGRVFHMDLFGEALFWQAKVGGRDYAYSASNMTNSKPKTPFRGSVSEVSFDWDWGFKVGLGFIFSEEMWSLNCIYTRFITSNNEGEKKNWPEGFMGLTGYLTPALESSSNYRISYNDISFEFGRNYYVSSNLNLQPFIGLKNTWIHQKQQSKYLINLKQDDLISFNSDLKDCCDFWGIGPQMGLSSSWFITRVINILFKTSGSLLYGKYDVSDSYFSGEVREIQGREEETNSSVFLKGDKSFISPFVDFTIGLGYQEYIYQDKLQLKISLAYEAQYYWRQNEMLKASGSLKKSYNSMTGAISKVGFQRTAEDLAFFGVSALVGLFF